MEATTQLKQLPIWPLVLGTVLLGVLSLAVGLVVATVLSLFFLFALSRMPNTATITLCDERLTVRGWMGAFLPFPQTRSLPRSGLGADIQTAAGEDDTFVHVLTFTSRDQTVRLAGVQSSPTVVHALVQRITTPAGLAEAG